jgi:hypothetical protein
MQAASLPASAGWQWARDGLRLFRKQPLALFTWALAISLIGMFAWFTAPIGPLLFVTLMPAITLMTLSACKHVEADRVMLPSMWPKPLQQPGVFKKLFIMGTWYTTLGILAGIVSFVPYWGDLTEGVRAASITNDVVPFLEVMQAPLLIFGTLYVIIAALFWHAPVLVAWHGLRMRQALFFSGIACWRNKWAFLVYGVTWMAIFLGIDLCASALVSVGLPVGLVVILKIPVNIMAFAVLYSSFYPAYTSVFSVNNAGFQLDNGSSTQA